MLEMLEAARQALPAQISNDTYEAFGAAVDGLEDACHDLCRRLGITEELALCAIFIAAAQRLQQERGVRILPWAAKGTPGAEACQ